VDIPGLPTDNLYKFLALSGLLSAGFIWWGVTKRWEALVERAYGFNTKVRERNIQLQHLVIDSRIMTPETEGILKERIRKNATDEQADEVLGMHLQDAIDRLKKLSVHGLGVMAFALLMSVFGFFAWYLRVQRYQDEQTIDAAREQRARADLVEVELSKAQRSSRRHRR